MKKIPTMFERDWAGDRSRVLDKVTRGCEWVLAGEGIATRKLDGTSCMIRDGALFKRRELREGDVEPPQFELSEHDKETRKRIGWIPVGNGPEDKWHREAFMCNAIDGTFELCGPKIQGNPEGYALHVLVRHSTIEAYPSAPRTFEALKVWLTDRDIEGLVFHHPDGRMAKIKGRDFGLRRKQQR